MKKISLTALGLFAGILGIFAQQDVADSAEYKSKRLSVEEVNLISSYYHQDGNHSPITGGIGSEKLNDYANIIELKLVKYSKNNDNLKHNIGIEMGVDHFTSASTSKISTSSASSSVSGNDTRFYPTLSYAATNEKKGFTIGGDYAFSKQFNYISNGLGISFSKISKDENREFSVKANVYLDKISLVYPSELVPVTTHSNSHASEDDDDHKSKYPKRSRNTFNTSFVYSQVFTKRFQMAFLLDLVYQTGYLSTPYHRVYFPNDRNTHLEVLPNYRFKLPVGFRANYFAGDRVILRSYYRFYYDTWGIIANTASIEMSIKITPFISISPVYRFHQQTGTKYYHPYQQADINSDYNTTDDDLSKFTSHFIGANFRFGEPNGIFKLKHWNMIEIRYGHYFRSDGLNSDIVSLNLKFK